MKTKRFVVIIQQDYENQRSAFVIETDESNEELTRHFDVMTVGYVRFDTIEDARELKRKIEEK